MTDMERDNTPSLAPILELGRGGVGRVFLALRRGAMGFERVVVVKRLHAHLADDPVVASRFVDEARIAAELHHANVVGVQQVGRDEQGMFLVFDYIEGESLQGLLELATRRATLIEPRVVFRIVADALAGLASVHEITDETGRSKGLLHRDISPDNLLVGSDGITRIADFGMARDPGRRRVTEPGTVVGKALFVAPEYIMERPIDARVDLYSLGVSCWMALSGVEPYPTGDDQATLLRAMSEGIPPLSEVVSDIPSAVEEFLVKACDREPRHRFASAREMAAALEVAAASWKGIGSQQEVAALVSDYAGTGLVERRARIGEARDASPLPSLPPPSDAPLMVREPRLSPPPPRAPRQEVIGSGLSAPIELPTTPVWKSLPAVVGAVVLVVALAMLALRGRGDEVKSEPAAPAAATPEPTLPASAPLPALAEPPPAVSSSAAPLPDPTPLARPTPRGPLNGVRPGEDIRKKNPYR